jgi:hypothetical protein
LINNNPKPFDSSKGFFNAFRKISYNVRMVSGLLLSICAFSGPLDTPEGNILKDWFNVLSDDRAAYTQWVSVAKAISMPVLKHTKDGKPIYNQLKGELLRAAKQPSVTQLLRRRSEIIAKSVTDPDSSLKIAYYFHRWDRKSATQTLREITQPIVERLPKGGFNQTDPALIGRCVTALRESSRSDHEPVFKAYTAWILSLKEVPSFPNAHGLLYPFALSPKSTLTNQLFADPNSIWNPKTTLKSNYLDMYNTFSSRLMTIPVFQHSVFDMLDDKTIIGTTEVKDDLIALIEPSGVRYKLDRKWDPAETVPDDLKENLRICDKIALAMMQIDEIPFFSPAWPESKRDLAIAKTRVFLKKNAKSLLKRLPFDIALEVR